MRTKKLLIDESPILVLPSLAEKIGLNEAIFLQQLNYWININLQNKENPTEWCYNTYAEWREQLPFLSESTIQRAVKSLKDKNLIVVDKRNKDRWNKTNYYTIDYDEVSKLEEFAGMSKREDITTQPPKQSVEQKEKPKDKLTQFRDLIMDNMKEMKILSIGKSKVNSTDDTKANFKAISNEAILNMEQLAKEYAEYVNRNRGRAVRLDKWLLACMERNLNDIEYAKDFSTTSSTQPLTDLDKEAIKKLEEIKKELPKIAIEENKILCNMEEVNALRAWRERNPTFYKELLGVDAKGEINLKDSAYVRHAIKERGYAKKFLTFVVNYTGRYGKVA